jgi:hypothetical protein
MKSAISTLCAAAAFALVATLAACSPEPELAIGPPPQSTLLLGGSADEAIRDIARDASGNVYVVGGTNSADFPTLGDNAVKQFQGDLDGFVTKVDPAGKIVWSTFVGGPSHDRFYAVAIDREGNLALAGRAGEGFPVTPGAFQTEFRGGPADGPYPPQDGVVAKMSSDGRLMWASYFGGSDKADRIVRDIDVDASGDFWIAATSFASDFPAHVLAGFARGNHAAAPPRLPALVVARIAGDGSEVRWASWLASKSADLDVWGQPSLGVTPDGEAVVVTVVDDPSFPTSEGAFDRTHNGVSDFHVTRWDASGQLRWATWLGGSEMEQIETHQLAIDPAGNPVIGAGTKSEDFPTTEGAYARVHAGNGEAGTGLHTNYPGDCVVARLSADGAKLLASTFLGGELGDSIEGIAVDPAGNVVVAGGTYSSDFPTTGNAFVAERGGVADAFVAVLDPSLAKLGFSTYLGLDAGAARAAAADASGFLATGECGKPCVWPGATGVTPAGGSDAPIVAFSATLLAESGAESAKPQAK